jgi:hypothetical protein
MSTNQERIIKVVQSSTKRLVDSFLEKSGRLSNNIEDIKNLLREGYDTNIAFNTAKALFGSEKVKFLAIDGTVSEDQRLDQVGCRFSASNTES